MISLVLYTLGGLVLGSRVRAQGAGHFFFDWPAETARCDVVDLTWSGGSPPFTAFIVPTPFKQPFVYPIPSSAYKNGQGSYPIQLQLDQGTAYVVFVADAISLGAGGSSEIQIVQNSTQSSCLNSASSNYSSHNFDFTVTGQSQQCTSGFDLSWTDNTSNEPYNFTVVPLDQSSYPFDVSLDDNQNKKSWQPSLNAGTRFTIMMNDKNGYGTGGTAGIYEVTNSTQTNCITQPLQATGTWPAGLATTTLFVISSSALSGGAIAGIVIGVMSGFFILALLIWLLFRRRRQRRKTEKMKGQEMDLGDEMGEGSYEHLQPNPMVEPYRPVGSFVAPPGVLDSQSYSEIQSQTQTQSPSESQFTPQSPRRQTTLTDYTSTHRTSAGFAGLGAGLPEWSDPIDSTAGPLPTKNSLSVRTPSGQSSEPRTPTGMRVVNHDSPDSLPVTPNRVSQVSPRVPTFRRHEDAGRVEMREDIVDLPPLYTDVPRDDIPG